MAFSLSAKGIQSSHGKENGTVLVHSLGAPVELSSESSIQGVSSAVLASPASLLKFFLKDPNSAGHIFSFLSPLEIARAERVCKVFKITLNPKDQSVWKRQCAIYDVMIHSASAVKYKKEFLDSQPKIAYGSKEWAECIGDVGKVPPLSPRIHEVLKSQSPFWPEKTVKETCILVLIPATVNGKPLTLRILGPLVEASSKGNQTGFRNISTSCLSGFGDTPVKESHWVLMTKNVLPESRNQGYAFQKELVEKAGYKIPGLVEASAGYSVTQPYFRRTPL